MDLSLYSLYTATRGMQAAQAGLNTAGNNLANANTEGYSRRTVVATPSPSISLASFNTPVSLAQLGGGVDVKAINRIRDQFLDVRMRTEQAALGQNTTLRDEINFVQDQFGEPGNTGLASVLTNFWNAWDQLAVNPESSAARSEVRQLGQTVADTFNQLSSSLSQRRSELDSQITRAVIDVNNYTTQIAELNKEISASRTLGSQPNDLLDQRDLMVDKLSKIVSVSTQVMEDGKMYVYMGGLSLVTGDGAEPLTTAPNDEGSYNKVTFRNQEVPGRALGGTMAALYQMRDEIIGRPDQKTQRAGVNLGDTTGGMLYQLDQMANAFAQAVNQTHSQGTGLDGVSGRNFFTNKLTGSNDDTFLGALNLTLTSEILDPQNGLNAIAAAGPNTSGTPGPGDNQTATQLSLLRSQGLFTTGETLDDRYRTFLANLGVQGQAAERNATNQQNLIDHLTSQRESVAGINMDQEMSDLVRFQHAYNASAKIISVMDQVLDKLINGMPPGR